MLTGRNRRYHVLVIDEELPLPADTGKKTRTFNLFSRISTQFAVTYVAYCDPFRDASKIRQLELLGLTVVPVPRKAAHKGGLRFYGRLLGNLWSSLPYIVWSHYSKAMEQEVQRLLSRRRFDLIHYEITPYVIFASGRDRTPKIAVAHNIESEIWELYARTERNPLTRAYARLQWSKVERFERTWLPSLSACIAVTERDAETLKRQYGVRRAYTVPNGVDLAYFSSTNGHQEGNRLVFTGSMDWRPNQDAVAFFLEEIYPLILNDIPRASFDIVGRNPPPWIPELARHYPNTHVSGSVNDVRPFLERATLCVVPLRIGGGSRLKILEAMAMRKAVVSTSLGAGGLAVSPGVNIALADDAQEFARKTVDVLQNRKFRDHLVANAVQFVSERHCWETIVARMETAWRDTIERESHE